MLCLYLVLADVFTGRLVIIGAGWEGERREARGCRVVCVYTCMCVDVGESEG